MWTPLNITTRTYVSARFMNPKKFTSILADVPVRPRSPWQIYLRENLCDYKKDNGKVDAQLALKELSKKWKVMGDADKKVFADTFHKECQIHDKILEETLQKATPKQFREENKLRAKYDLTKLKDPKAPKLPKSAFLLYLEHLRKTNDPLLKKGMAVKEQAKVAGTTYKSLNESDKKVFVDEAKKLMDQYKANKAKYDAMV